MRCSFLAITSGSLSLLARVGLQVAFERHACRPSRTKCLALQQESEVATAEKRKIVASDMGCLFLCSERCSAGSASRGDAILGTGLNFRFVAPPLQAFPEVLRIPLESAAASFSVRLTTKHHARPSR